MIHAEHQSIAKAAKLTGIPYDNAKAINRTYVKEKRVSKIAYRLRYLRKQKKVNQPIESLAGYNRQQEVSDVITRQDGMSDSQIGDAQGKKIIQAPVS